MVHPLLHYRAKQRSLLVTSDSCQTSRSDELHSLKESSRLTPTASEAQHYSPDILPRSRDNQRRHEASHDT
ncbi:hypothetical protein LshimejAT787_0603820 [Lyophyllum shimeji]|uniref:Uncharacterized protein n=1 Tax=Lyophyllum shimeji TaxID=47721 RepID=A0A9P3UPP0_LYOSH|nr:hypothetical protein LshimejAT787_0603820 [Lyophyllum shimeji]